jgi:hypothetical protein
MLAGSFECLQLFVLQLVFAWLGEGDEPIARICGAAGSHIAKLEINRQPREPAGAGKVLRAGENNKKNESNGRLGGKKRL